MLYPITKSSPAPLTAPISATTKYMLPGLPPIMVLSALGQMRAFFVISKLVPPTLKNSDCKLSYCSAVICRRPVAESGTPPVACWNA